MSLSADPYDGPTQATVGERPDDGIGRRRMKAILATDEAAGTAGMTLAERPEPAPAINEVVVQVHAAGFTSGELTWRQFECTTTNTSCVRSGRSASRMPSLRSDRQTYSKCAR